MRHLLALLLALPLTGCIRGCGAGPSPSALAVAGSTSQSIVVKHPSGEPGSSWTATLVAAEPGSVAPTVAQHPTVSGRHVARWTTPDGAHELVLTPTEGGLIHGGGTIFFHDRLDAGLLLLPYGEVLEFEGRQAPPLERTTWTGQVGERTLSVVVFSAGKGQTRVLLLDGARLRMEDVGGRLETSVGLGDGRLTHLKVASPKLSFEVELPDPAAIRVETTARIDDRESPLILVRGEPSTVAPVGTR